MKMLNEAVLWQKRDLLSYLQFYGIAADPVPIHWAPQQAYLPQIIPEV
ncbi:MAG: hypothetical protein ACI9TH_001415 [Kiritimatiellia bacterium]|jgi:hypothetical protein